MYFSYVQVSTLESYTQRQGGQNEGREEEIGTNFDSFEGVSW